MHMPLAEIVGHHNPFQPLGLEELSKHVLKHVYLHSEAIKMLGSRLFASVCPRPSNKPASGALLHLGWWKIRERQKILALEMGAFVHELLPAFVIDYASDSIGKCAVLWIARSTGADRVTLDHPTGPEPQHMVQTRAQCVHFGCSRGHHIWTAIRPARQQATPSCCNRMPSSIRANGSRRSASPRALFGVHFVA